MRSNMHSNICVYVDEIIGSRSDTIIMCEKVSLYYRCVQHIATSLHKARNHVSSGEIKKSQKFRQVCLDLANLYQKTGEALTAAKTESVNCGGMSSSENYQSSCSLALEEDHHQVEQDEAGACTSESDSSSEEEPMRSADKLVFVYALSLSMHAAGIEITVGTSGSPVNFTKKKEGGIEKSECEDRDGNNNKSVQNARVK